MSASQLPTNAFGDEPTAVSASRAGTRRADGEDPTRALRTRHITAGTAAGPGLVLERYRPTKRLGSGAFGTVWAARDERLDRDVAVKVLPRERVIHARFEREARAAARLQHPAIVTLYEAAVDDDGAYLVSELVRGRTLDALLEQGKLSDREILEVGVCLCDALAHAHAQGVIHRDVKPSNVLVPGSRGRSRAAGAPFGSGDLAKLTDFGVAHVIGGATLTHTGDVVGTLAYMAPEQADGREAGPEADLYSLALVLYEALTGINPQAAGRRPRRNSFVPPLRRQRRDLSRRLAAGIDQALRPRPYDRGSLLDLRATLLQSLDAADEVPGVVAPGWRARDDEDTWIQDQPGPEWGERGHGDAPQLRLSGANGVGGVLSAGGAAALGAAWLPRAANAAGAGLGAAWLSMHLWHHPQLPPAVVALAAAVIALILPLVGTLLTGVALGAVTLAGALPAVVAQVGYSWWQRALAAAGALALLVGVGRTVHHNLYWLPAQIPPHRTLELAAFGVWAFGAAIQPFLRVRRFPVLDLLLCVAWSVALVVGMEAVGLRSPVGELPGALLATAIVAWQPALAIVDQTRYAAGIYSGVS